MIAAGLIWVGPFVGAVAAMGSKIESKKMMPPQGAGSRELDPAGITADHLPVLVKASAGGGRRGMRVVTDLTDMAAQVEAASRGPHRRSGMRRCSANAIFPPAITSKSR